MGPERGLTTANRIRLHPVLGRKVGGRTGDLLCIEAQQHQETDAQKDPQALGCG